MTIHSLFHRGVKVESGCHKSDSAHSMRPPRLNPMQAMLPVGMSLAFLLGRPSQAQADTLIEIAHNQLALEIGYWGYVRSGGEEEQFGWLVPVPHPVGITNIFDEISLDGSQAFADSDLFRTVTDTWIESQASPITMAYGDAFASAHAVDKVTLVFDHPVPFWISAEAESTNTSRAWVILSNMVNQTRILFASNSSDTASGQLPPGTYALDAFAEANGNGSASFHYTLNVLFPPYLKMQSPAGAPILSAQGPDVGRGTDFADLMIPGAATNTFVIFNEGDWDLEFSGQHWFGQHPESFQIVGLPAVVPARSSNTFRIVFAPSWRGEHDAIVFLANTSSNVPAFEVRLHGTAWQWGPLVSHSTNTHFTAVYQGDYPSNQTAWVENQGDFTIHYDTQIQYNPATEEWLLVEPAAGEIGGLALAPLAVEVEHYGLNAGEYQAIIQVMPVAEEMMNATPAEIPVVLTVTKAGQSVIDFSPDDCYWHEHLELWALVSSGLPAWFRMVSGPGVITEDNLLSFTNVGEVIVEAYQPGNMNYLPAPPVQATIKVLPLDVLITFSNLVQVYNGSPIEADYKLIPTNALIDILYNGTNVPPTTAGVYRVEGVSTSALYRVAGTATNLIIQPAPATLALSNATSTYTGTAIGLIATTVPPGLDHALTYNGSTSTPVNAGTYEVVAEITDPNYSNATDSATLTILKASPGLTWNPPAPMAGDQPLGPGQLSATASTAGSFAYTPGSGTVLEPGLDRPLSVVFTPSDLHNYLGTNQSVTVDVYPVIQVSANSGGSVTPRGRVVVPYGSSQSFAIQAADYYHIASVSLLGQNLSVPPGATDFTASRSSVTQNGVLNVQFAAETTVNGVPLEYLLDHGLTNAPEVEALDDPDDDKVPTWMEYWSGTDPTNKVSCLGCTAPEPTVGGAEGIVLRWSSILGKWYDVQRGTNLMDIPPFVPVIINVEGLAGFTTVTDRTATANSPYYYRITVAY